MSLCTFVFVAKNLSLRGRTAPVAIRTPLHSLAKKTLIPASLRSPE